VTLKLVADVVTADGQPLGAAEATLHLPRGARLVRAGTGQVKAGRLELTAEAELGPVWGLRIDGRAVLALPWRQAGEVLELLPIELLAVPLALKVPHALRGEVWGRPRFGTDMAAAGAPARPSAAASLASPVAMSDLVTDAAKQIHFGASASAGLLQLSTANVTLSGVGSKVGDQLSMQFPTTAEELATAAVTTLDLKFAPPAAAGPAPPPPAPPPTVPQVVGYTRELAQRKLAAARFAVQMRMAATASPQDAGRVLRQIPAAGQPLTAGEVVLLFVAQGVTPEPIE
jgi:PASTA domain